MSKKTVYAGFKKVSEDQHKVVMRHSDGHEVHVAKSALSPKMRGQLAEIPMHMEDTNPAGSRAVKDNKGQVKMAGGGGVSMAQQRQSLVDAANGTKTTKPGDSTPQPYADKPAKLSPTAMKGETAAPKQDPEARRAKEDAESIPIDFHKMADGGEVNIGAGGLSGDAPSEIPLGLQKPTNPAEQSLAAQQQAFQSSPDQALFGTNAPMVAEAVAPTPANIAASTPGAQAQQAAMVTAQQKSVDGVPPSNMQGPNPSNDPYGLNTTYNATIQGINEQKAGIGAEAKALGAQGVRDAASLQEGQQKLQALGDQFQTYTTELAKHDQELLKTIQEGKIDPTRYLGSQSTVQRISTGIGLILGGMGAGLTGGPNLAAQMLQQNIDRDIDAQKTNLGKQVTLYSANLSRMQNAREALSATRAQMMDMASMKLKASAATAQDPLAKARALKAAGELDQQTAAMRGSQAMRMTMLSGVRSGQVGPDQAVQFLIPADQRPAATKELQEAQEAVKARSNALNAFDQVAKAATVGQGMMHPFDNPRQIAALTAPITAQLSKATAGRFTEQDAGMLATLWPRRGESPETQAIKRAQMMKLINEKMNYPVLKAWNLDPGHWGTGSAEGSGGGIQESAPVQRKR